MVILKLWTLWKVYILDSSNKKENSMGGKKVHNTNCLINSKSMEKFKKALQEMIWENIISSKTNWFYLRIFHNKFTSLYGKIYGKVLVTVKSKTPKYAWITKGILKSAKTKKGYLINFWSQRLLSMRNVIKTTVNYLNWLKKEESHNITQRWYFITKITYTKLDKLYWKLLTKANISTTTY